MKYGRLPKRHKPGTQWRTLAWKRDEEPVEDDSDNHDGSVFDELVIDGWLHLEQMDTRSWWIGLNLEDPDGNKYPRICLWVDVGERGQLRHITITEDVDDERVSIS